MKRIDLFDELTYIDDDLILEAHETPVPRHSRFSLRRAAVLLAAVITLVAMSVATVATMTEDLDAKVLWFWNQMVKGGYDGYFTHDENYQYELQRDTAELDGRQVEIKQVYVYNLHKAELQVDCEGGTMEVMLEAMVLMGDGQVKYKSRTIRGDDAVTVTLDNLIAGEPGTIVHLRRTTKLLEEEGWKTVMYRNTYMADDFGYKLPNGTDVRFPDTKRENYHWWEALEDKESDRDTTDEVFQDGLIAMNK